ncbi:hypothetical protein HBZS_105240 [Helicobacter bizzozeronii CCUG 35545]|nr:hypothetical protein HBZS_105240 [Helicobacter bizzozeronii CCUG 35545]
MNLQPIQQFLTLKALLGVWGASAPQGQNLSDSQASAWSTDSCKTRIFLQISTIFKFFSRAGF